MSFTAFFTPLKRDTQGFPDGSVVKNPPANAGDSGLISGSGRSTGEGNGNLCQLQGVGHDLVTKQQQPKFKSQPCPPHHGRF